MSEPVITCPKCKNEIKLTESLAAPLVESMRQQYEQKLTQKEADISKREATMRAQQETLAKAQESIDK